MQRAQPIKITFSPLQKAESAIRGLQQRDDLKTSFIIGGGTQPPKMVGENKRKEKLFLAEKLKVIKKYRVVRHFAAPVIDDIQRLRDALRAKTKELRDYQSICPHRKAQPGKKCPDCSLPASKRR